MAIKGGKINLFNPVAFDNNIVDIGDVDTAALAPFSVVVGADSQVTAFSFASVVVGPSVTIDCAVSVGVGTSSSISANAACIAMGWANTINAPRESMSIAIGSTVTILSGNAIGVGNGLGIGTLSSYSVVAGNNNSIGNSCDHSFVFGHTNTIHNNNASCIVVGQLNDTAAFRTISIGTGNTNPAADTLLVGAGILATAAANQSIGLGVGLVLEAPYSIAAGPGAGVHADVQGDGYGIAIGSGAQTGPGSANGSTYSIAIGAGSSAHAANSIVIGLSASATQNIAAPVDSLIVIGDNASGGAVWNIAIGSHAAANAGHLGSQAFGAFASTSQALEIVFASETCGMDLFHVVSREPTLPSGVFDLFRFDTAGLSVDLDTNFYLLYKDSGVVKYAKVQLQVDEVIPTHGHLYVIIDDLPH